jgi:hypothetical protein
MSEYLWDRSGAPDPLVARLERALAPLAPRPRRPAFVAVEPRRRWFWFLALGLVGATAGALLVMRVAQARDPGPLIAGRGPGAPVAAAVAASSGGVAGHGGAGGYGGS